MTDKCNCGNPIRYSHKDGNSCNKYVICPTYDELRREHEYYRRISLMYANTLTTMKNTNACDHEYRTWAKNALELADSWKEDLIPTTKLTTMGFREGDDGK